jgi:hypothetical protein
MEEPATAQMKEKTTDRLRAVGVGASTTVGTSACTDCRKMMVVHLAQLTPQQGTTRDERP